MTAYRDQEHAEAQKRARAFRIWLAQAAFVGLVCFVGGLAAESCAHSTIHPHTHGPVETPPARVEPQPGDLVWLRSGGPMMTLGEVDFATGTAYCVRWYRTGGMYVHETFNVDALEIVPEDER